MWDVLDKRWQCLQCGRSLWQTPAAPAGGSDSQLEGARGL